MATQTEQRNKPAVRQAQPPAAALSPEQALEVLEQLAKQYSLPALEAKNRFQRVILLAQGIKQLREAVRPIMPFVMELMNTQLGFTTDRPNKRNPEPYPEHVVRDCFIEATLRGFAPTGNEWGIISGKFYGNVEGYENRVKEIPGLTDLRVHPGVPATGAGGALVPIRATWKFRGKTQGMRCEVRKNEEGVMADERIPVRLHGDQGADAAIGKARRKILFRIHKQLTNSNWTDQELDDGGPAPAEAPAPEREAAGGAALPGGGTQFTHAGFAWEREALRRLGKSEREFLAPWRVTSFEGLHSPDARAEAHLQIEELLAEHQESPDGEGEAPEPGRESLFPPDEAPAIQQERR